MDELATNSGKSAFKPVWGLVVILAGLCVIMGVRSYWHHDIIPWRHDFSLAEKEAQQKGKMRLLDFSSEACEPCEEMNRTTWADARVLAALKNYVPVRIDFLKETELDARLGVEAIPTMIVLDSQGHVVKVMTGGMDAEEFLEWIKGNFSSSPG
jgi:thiol:disulfide interchange protein